MLTRRPNRTHIVITALTLLLCAQAAHARTTAFTNQGKLADAGNPANAAYDMQFKIFDALTNGTHQGVTITKPTVGVTAGIFTVELDFGTRIFDGTARYLEIGVRPAGSPDPYTVLAPRQPFTAARMPSTAPMLSLRMGYQPPVPVVSPTAILKPWMEYGRGRFKDHTEVGFVIPKCTD